ncbi:MAG: response regulator [bacterium]
MKDQTLRVLLIEDDPGEARLIREMLRRSPNTTYDLRHAGNLSDGLAFLHVVPADIVLLDLSLPDSNGLDTLAKLTNMAPGVPVIVQTGLSDDEIGRTALRRGAQDFLVKGRFDGHMLNASIRYAVERSRLFQKVASLNQAILEVERNRVMQEAVGGAAHAISQPLTILTMVTSQIMDELQPNDRLYEKVTHLCNATERITRIVRDMSNLRKQTTPTYPGDVQILDVPAASRGDGADMP